MTHDLQFKITDFGLSERDYFDLTIAPAKSNCTLQPICWLAYEVLQSKAKVYESDVWSFGVYMWEVFEFGCGKPYVFLKVRTFDLCDLFILIHFDHFNHFWSF